MATPPDPEADRIFSQFEDIFAGGFDTQEPIKKDLTRLLEIELEEASEGGTHEFSVQRVTACEVCAGARGEGFKPCGSCGGSGRIGSEVGPFLMRTRCEPCGGKGGQFAQICPACDGAGGEPHAETLTVQIPPGVPDGQRLRLGGKGNIVGGESGDLYLRIFISPDPPFERDGDDLVLHHTITRELAKQGGKTTVPLIRGEGRITVPAGSHTGDAVRVRGFGMLKLGSPPMPAPSSDGESYRSVDTREHRHDLVVKLRIEGEDAAVEPPNRLSPGARVARHWGLAATVVVISLFVLWLVRAA